MPRPAYWPRHSALPVLIGVAAWSAACTDALVPTPRPPRDIGVCAPGDPCTGSPFGPGGPGSGDALTCEELRARAGTNVFCNDASTPPDTAARRVRITRAEGPNAEKSFTAKPGENGLTLTAEVTPSSAAPELTWTLSNDSGDRAASAAPAGVPNGPSVNSLVPRQDAGRWQRVPHPGTLAEKALAFKVVAELPASGGKPAARDSVVVRQREVDVLRQEYIDFGIDVPPAADVRKPADVAGVTRFTWAQLNQGDYGYAVLTPVLLSKLNELDRVSKYPLTVNSAFRNPVHQRFHIQVSGGGRVATKGQHQYGTAADVNTARDPVTWVYLRDLAKAAGACTEPYPISTVNHVHADWRPGWPQCPKGW